MVAFWLLYVPLRNVVTNQGCVYHYMCKSPVNAVSVSANNSYNRCPVSVHNMYVSQNVSDSCWLLRQQANDHHWVSYSSVIYYRDITDSSSLSRSIPSTVWFLLAVCLDERRRKRNLHESKNPPRWAHYDEYELMPSRCADVMMIAIEEDLVAYLLRQSISVGLVCIVVQSPSCHIHILFRSQSILTIDDASLFTSSFTPLAHPSLYDLSLLLTLNTN